MLYVKAKIEKKLVSAPGTVFKPASSGLMTVLPGKASFHCALLHLWRAFPPALPFNLNSEVEESSSCSSSSSENPNVLQSG